MVLPEEFLSSLEDSKGFEREAFEKIHASAGQVTSIRLNPDKFSIENVKFKIENKVPWSRHGVYLTQRPSFTFDPLFHAGCYYVQEASSMFLEQALSQTVDLSQSLKILDLCAAPGGKSTHIQSLISQESLLVSNEVIRSRVPVLKDNIIKWGAENVVVTQNDPKEFSSLKNYFDIIVIDAPCSGSGLFRRDPEAVSEWSLSNVKLCSMRQQRIIADVLPALKNDGILIYSTCSYSKEENEDICKWLIDEMRIQNLKLKIENKWNVVESSFGYRFWPDKVKGEGFFLACFKKSGMDDDTPRKARKIPEQLNKKELAIISNWLRMDTLHFFKHENIIYMISGKHRAEIPILLQQLRVKYAGVGAGEIIHDKLIPGHALAMSSLLNESIPVNRLDHSHAIEYLKKKEIRIEPAVKGWQLVQYEGHNLGWINVLSNRINNYYPKELRILKEN
ncbi:MAG: Fmu (Sun) domain protein [Chitinophagaceae bacterium]|nr:Fmu (Sun) domain protein [Chitinophagaceae bacterium]